MKEDLSTLEPLISAETLEEVFYQEGLDGTPVKISLEKLKEKIPGFELNENLLVKKELAQAFAKACSEQKLTPLQKEGLDLLQKPFKDLVICSTGDEKRPHILLAGRDIKKGELVLINTGEICSRDTYGEEDCHQSPFSPDDNTIAITQYRKGGRVRFLSDLPYDAKTLEENRRQTIDAVAAYHNVEYSRYSDVEREIVYHRTLPEIEADEIDTAGRKVSPLAEEIKFHPPLEPKDLALANLTRILIKLGGLPITAFRATTDIPKGHIMGWVYSEHYRYGKQYWRSKGLPQFVTPQGKIINNYHFSPQGPNYHSMVERGKQALPSFWITQLYEQGVSALEVKAYADAGAHFCNALDCWERGMLLADELKITPAQLGAKFVKDCWESGILLADELKIIPVHLEAKFANIADKLDGAILYNHSVALYEAGHYKLAIIELKGIQKKFSAESDKNLEALSLCVLSSCYEKLEQISEAKAAINQAWELVTTITVSEAIKEKIHQKKEQLEHPQDNNLSQVVEAAVSGAGSFLLNPKSSNSNSQVSKSPGPKKK